MRNAADMLTPVTLELGGKDAFIVCEDADVEHVWIFPTSTSVYDVYQAWKLNWLMAFGICVCVFFSPCVLEYYVS